MTDWIEWKGGERPVPPDTRVEVRYRTGATDRGLAGSWAACWLNDGAPDDIVAYRVVSEELETEWSEDDAEYGWIEFPKWYRHDGGPAPCPPEIWVEVPGQYAQVRREHAATIQWYGVQYWRPADDRYEFKFDGDRLVAYRLKEAHRD